MLKIRFNFKMVPFKLLIFKLQFVEFLVCKPQKTFFKIPIATPYFLLLWSLFEFFLYKDTYFFFYWSYLGIKISPLSLVSELDDLFFQFQVWEVILYFVIKLKIFFFLSFCNFVDEYYWILILLNYIFAYLWKNLTDVIRIFNLYK